jgi:hypothetical protein
MIKQTGRVMAWTRSILVTIFMSHAPSVVLAQAGGTQSIMDVVARDDLDLQKLRERLGTFREDGRSSIVDLFSAQSALRKRPGWILEEIFREEISLPDGRSFVLPSNCLRTTRKGPSLWVLTGIHGEEPAGPNALAANLAVLRELADKGIPLVVMPLLNPLGYQRNWRYPDAAVYSEAKPGSSVGDSEHLLPGQGGAPRRDGPACRQAGLLTARVLELARDYPPVLSLDLHEDNLLRKGYLYSQGTRGADDPVAAEIMALLLRHQFPILMEGTTRFGEAVKGGIVSGVNDGSIDELISASTVIVNHIPRKGPSGGSVLVLETSAMDMPLSARVKVHATVIGSLESLWRNAKAGFQPR